ncbi:hypothetical protein IWQ60_004291 [Tieghemiomyces parasiticus]|uniref:Cytosol aminopeptidase domain-containing protein n=1 Tax=Tieghemiomyces parasiticus TaxID=78921 RepID=A0A9W8A8L8_9FUNG|nr:hypothetical protein IWQ60_004291 [Tieghemiomyces parasiticus]
MQNLVRSLTPPARHLSSATGRLSPRPSFDSLVIPVHQGTDLRERLTTLLPDPLGQQLGTQAAAAGSKGKLNECHILYPDVPALADLRRVALVGTGQAPEAREQTPAELDEKTRVSVASAVKSLRSQGSKRIGVAVPEAHIAAAAAAASLALFDPTYAKTVAKPSAAPAVFPVTLAGRQLSEEAATEAWERGWVYGEAQNLARRWMDTPANLMTPSAFAAEVETHLGPLANVTVTAHDTDWAVAQKMGLFLGVAQGSAEPARFLEIHYRGAGAGAPTLGLVGKGVTFDTGGIDIKPWQGMEDMKADMGGAACVAATLYGIASLRMPINVVCAIPLCENMPGGRAVKPGDVLTAMNGQTVEVLNTDAEGRLILADALYYVSTVHRPSVLLDVATLTGAMAVALGSTYTGVFTNSDTLWSALNRAGNAQHELLWRMPMHPEYREVMRKSRVADLANLSASRGAGSCTAAMFLREFVGEPVRSDGEDDAAAEDRTLRVESSGAPVHYAHLDIAGVMSSKAGNGYNHDGMSGRPTRALIAYVQQLAQAK